MEIDFWLRDVINGLQAGQIAQARMLRAIISTHPDPAALRKAWASYAGGPMASAATSKVIDPGREEAHQALVQAMQDWTERLERDLPAP